MTTQLRTIYQNQLQKEITINYNFKAVAPTGIFADRGNQLGLTFNYYGGKFQKSDGTVEDVADGSINLTDNTTNYIFFNATTNAVEANTTGVDNGNFPIAEIVTANGVISSITDLRVFALYSKGTRSDLAYSLPKATTDILGGIKIGSGLTIAEDGTVSVSSSGSSSLTITYNGSLIKSNVSSINFLGSGVSVIDNNGVVDVSIIGGGSTSELTYLNDLRNLKYSWKPQHGSVTTLNVGTFSNTSSAFTSQSYSSIETFNKYPIWNKYDVLRLNTVSTANSNSAIYGNSGNHFKRNGSTRCIVHQLFGCVIFSSIISTSNSIFVIGVTLDPDGSSGNTIGTNNDFTSIKSSTIGVCWRSTDTNLQIIYFDTSNVLTFIDLGSNFPVPNEANNIKSAYELIIDDLRTTTNVKITVKRLDANFETSNIINPIEYSVTTNSYRSFCQLRTLEGVQKSVGVSDMYIYQF